jgi:PKD repeat protein
MKRIAILIISLFVGFAAWTQEQPNLDFAQQTLADRGEFYFEFKCDSPETIVALQEHLSFDHRQGNTYYAYALSDEAFDEFLEYGFKFQPIESYYDQSKALTMATTTAQMASWDRYPTHAVYLQMLDDFAANYPNLCRVETIGTSENGVAIKSLVISDNVNTDEDEPEFWWSGTMHGDETTGYVLLLRMADYLLSNYGTDTQVTNLVDEIEIYINPLANPDGTFNGSAGLDDVSGSTRANSNGIDLNRNFPTLNGDSYTLQDEITCMMDYSNNHDFVMSVNTHGGIELMNYPWDTWQSDENLHPDTDWWIHVAFTYADQVELDAPSTYFEGPGTMYDGSTNTTGVTHGADWYYAIGSRQDYMNYYRNCREITLELSDTKTLGTEYLNTYWDYNKQAMLDYTEQVLYGFRGIVSDACTGTPLSDVKVEIVGHDQDNTEVYTSAPVGNYHRPVNEGSWDVTFSKTGYQSQTHTVSVTNNTSTRLDVQLIPDGVGTPQFTADQTSIFEGETVNFTDQSTGTITAYNWTLNGATPNTSTDASPSAVYNTAGTYDVNLEITSEGCTVNELKQDYISVSAPTAPTADFSASATTVNVGGTVDFTDLTTGNPASWSWTFDGGTPATETAQNPTVTYNTAGTYDVSMTATNAYGSDTETKTGYINVVVDYCDAGSASTAYEYLSNVVLGTIDNASGQTSYSDFTAIMTDAYPGDDLSFTATLSGGYGTDHVLVWADWNRDGDFVDTGESVYTSAEGAGPHSGTISVPGTVTSGQVRVRVRLEDNGNGPVNDPCGTSDYGEVEDYTINVVLPNVPPTAAFSAAETSNCNGIIQFQDESTLAESWSWDFGDGNTSTQQNPLHTYDADGTYTVSLTVSNAYGSDDTTMTDYITIDMPDAPLVADEENCGAGSVTLSATAAGEINWYDAQTGGNLLATGTDYTDNFSATTTVYADNTIENPQYYVGGKADNTGDGGYFTNTNQHGLIFDAYTDLVIETVKVYADGAADRTISLLDNTDTEIASTTVAIPDGESVVTLNFNVPAGTNYTLMGPASPNLFRNGGGTTGVLAYPFETPGVLSIHDNTAGNLEYYYYFYDWQVRVDETCVSPRTAATVTIHDMPAVDLGADQEICEGDDYTFDAGSGFSSYLWNTGETTQTITADTAGNYSVDVTDANGCTASDAANLNVNPVPVLSFSSTPENGTDGDGSISVSVTSGDLAPMTYVWDHGIGAAGSTITGLSAGTYCVTVTNANGCDAAGCETLTSTSPSPIADFEADVTEGCGSLTVQFTDLSANTPTSWSWDFGDGNTSTDQNPLHTYSSAGTYTVELTTTNSYGSDTHSITDYITVYDEITINESSESVSCNGGSDADITASVYGGEGTYAYYWEDGSGTSPGTTQTLTALPVGNYYLTVTDAAGCTASGAYTVTEPDPLQVTVSTTNESAAGACDGTATANVTGGTPGYTYNWDVGQMTQTATNLCAGSYQVTVTDANGCTAINSGEVQSGPHPPGADFEADVTEGCGSLTVQFTDLSANTPTSWSWDFGDGNTSTDQNPLHTYSSAGTYTVELTATNSYGSDTHSITDYITVYEEITISEGSESVWCNGDSNAEITASVNGGEGTYSYYWEDGSGTSPGTTQTLSNLSAGNYYLTVTDAAGCSASGTYTVTEPDPLQVTVTTTNESSAGACDGTATANVTGGTPPYSYNWSQPSGGMTQTINDLCAGNYQVTVMDNNGCTAIDHGDVAEGSQPPIADFEADVTEGCGSLAVQFTDLSSNAPTSWSWDFGDGNTSTDQNPLHTYSSAGTYTVELTATNSYGSDTHSITEYITVYDDLVVTDGSATLDCYGDTDGTITPEISGGDGNYAYNWENESGMNMGSEAVLTNVPAGTYYLSVTDGAGCSDNGAYTLTEPQSMNISFDIVSSTGPDIPNGSITAIPDNGAEPYVDFTWNTGYSGPTHENIMPGITYCVTVTDANGCTASSCTGFVFETLADFTADQTEGCEPLTVQFSDESTTDAQSWTWDFGDGESSTEQNPEHQYGEPGSYTVELSVENDAMETVSEVKTNFITVLERPELDFDVTDVSSSGQADGEITVLVSGNDAPYGFAWNTGDNTQTITGLEAGSYSVVVTGSNGCVATGGVQVQTTTTLAGDAKAGVDLYPNPASTKLYIEAGNSMASIRLYSVDGKLIHHLNPESTSAILKVDDLKGMYMLEISLENGERSIHQVVVQ